jgi:hypothetical protein
MLRTPTPEAEQIKVRYACALAQLATAEESIQVPSVGDRRRGGCRATRWRRRCRAATRRSSKWSQAELRRSGFEELVRAGMVLTGGASKMEGVVELAEEMLQMPVRIGIPQHVTGLGEVVGNPGPRHRRRPAADGQPDRASAPAVAAYGQGREPVQQIEELVPRRILIAEAEDSACAKARMREEGREGGH